MNLLFQSAAFLTAFAAYLSRVCPTIYSDDSPETITAAVTLGISHPPGDPLLSLAGKAWSLLPLGSMALRMNLLSAFLAATACLLVIRLVVSIFPGKLSAIAASSTTLVLFVFNPVLVQQAAVSKGSVYILNLVLILWAITSLSNKKNISASLALGLLASHHWMTFAAISPVMAPWWAFNALRLQTAKIRIIIISSLIFILGISVLLFLPLRASQNNYLAWGKPSTMQRMSTHLLRKVYQAEEMSGTPLTWRRQGIEGARAIHHQIGWPGWLLVSAGFIALFKSIPASAFIAASGILFPWLITSVYLDLRPELMHLLGIYLLPSWLAVVSLAAFGAAWLVRSGRKSTRVAAFLPAIASLFVLYPASRIYNVSRSCWSFDIGKAMLSPLPPNSGLLITSDMDTFPLWYFQAVEEYRTDILIVNTTMMRHQWYREQIEDISGVKRVRDLQDKDASLRYLIISSRRNWFSAAGDIAGVPTELPRVPYFLTYYLGEGRPVYSLRSMNSRGIFDCVSRLPENNAALALSYFAEVMKNNANPTNKRIR